MFASLLSSVSDHRFVVWASSYPGVLEMKNFFGGIAAALALASASGLVCATPIVLTFEGLQNNEAVNDFYNGGTGSAGCAGTNYGVNFSNSLALIDSDAGGTGNFANEPSASTILFFTAGSAVLNCSAGFTGGFSFFYTTMANAGSVDIYSEVNKGGTKLGSITIAALGSNCVGDPTGSFCNWAAGGSTFSGVAKSIDFGGAANFVGYDNITFGSSAPTPGLGPGTSVPEPGSLAVVAAAMLALGAIRRK
jgi:hypothetical protein